MRREFRSDIALKLASIGWRFLRYYTGNTPYRLEGPLGSCCAYSHRS